MPLIHNRPTQHRGPKEERGAKPKPFTGPTREFVPLRAFIVVDRNGYPFSGFALTEAGLTQLMRKAINDADPKDLPFTAVPVTISPRAGK